MASNPQSLGSSPGTRFFLIASRNLFLMRPTAVACLLVIMILLFATAALMQLSLDVAVCPALGTQWLLMKRLQSV